MVYFSVLIPRFNVLCTLSDYTRLTKWNLFVTEISSAKVITVCCIRSYCICSNRYFSRFSRDMWNYVDVLILLVYILIIVLRIVTVARGGNIYHNRLLEIVHYFYGINTLFLIVRFSSILELNAVVGPLQLALFRMCVDLFIIIVQFSFIIFAFSMAITKCYRAGISFDTPQSDDQYQQTNVTNHEP